jgi:hypothetical protein
MFLISDSVREASAVADVVMDSGSIMGNGRYAKISHIAPPFDVSYGICKVIRLRSADALAAGIGWH